jgi:succinyl-CoA synthetase beta subunit
MIEALRLLNSSNEVKSILVNIFGGILRCDLLVSAIIKATEMYNLKKSIVLRLKGTNADLVTNANIGSANYLKVEC